MLRLQSAYLNLAVMSLQGSGRLATTTAFLVNPNNLKIEGFFCQPAEGKRGQELILLTQDIRDFVPQGIAVNDLTSLSEPEDLVKFKKYIDLRYDVLGKKVITLSKDSVGKISDFAIDEQSFYIQKLYATQSVLASLKGGSLSIDRSQINEVTDKKIIIKDLNATVPAGMPATA